MRRRYISVAVTVVAVASLTIGSVGAAGPTGAEALAKLKAGNARFVSNPEDVAWVETAQRAALALGQTPFATILSCADSRVPPEAVFRAGLGELFVVRAAGNISDRTILASVEYAAEHLHVPLVVVMGHESCGAVKAAVETPASKSLGPNLDYMLKAIRPSVEATKTRPEAERLRAAILENVEETLNAMIQGSAILRDAGRSGHLTFVGAYYELTSGKVHFSEPANVSGVTAPDDEAPPTRGHSATGGRH